MSNEVPSVVPHVSFASQLINASVDRNLVISHRGECHFEAYEEYCAQQKILIGRVLTVIDSSIPDRQQNKALKDLIKLHFHDSQNRVAQTLTKGLCVLPDLS